MKGSIIVGFVIILAFLLSAVLIGANLLLFIDIPSVLIVGGIVIGGIVMSFGYSLPLRTMKTALQKEGVKDLAEMREYVNVLSMASQLSIAAGVAGTLIGVVQMLATMNDPSKIGSSLACALLTAFYGVFLSEMVFQPLKQALITKSAEVCDNTDSVGGSGGSSRWMVLGLGVFASLVPFAFLLISFVKF